METTTMGRKKVTDGNDVVEESVRSLDSMLLDILLTDRTTGKNILWCSEDYADLGDGFHFADEMLPDQLVGKNRHLIQPRSEKAKLEQQRRTRDVGEVFTPSWMCNVQNNLLDEAIFHRKNVFNVEGNNSWKRVKGIISFAGSGLTWQEYVGLNQMEITCGEAPYLVSRYDTVTGESIPIRDRIGLLDRKLRIVSEHCRKEETWVTWARTAFQSVYGYEYQGDNVLLARENLLFTFWDYYDDKFGVPPIKEYLEEFAEIISWNIWQMDGLKCVLPGSCKPTKEERLSLFMDGATASEIIEMPCPGCAEKNPLVGIHQHTGIYCLIRDWKENVTLEFASLLRGRNHD